MGDKKEAKVMTLATEAKMVGPLSEQGGDDDHREQIKHDLVAQGAGTAKARRLIRAQRHAAGGQEIIPPEPDTKVQGDSLGTRDG